jgi:hypothetical protein
MRIASLALTGCGSRTSVPGASAAIDGRTFSIRPASCRVSTVSRAKRWSVLRISRAEVATCASPGALT